MAAPISTLDLTPQINQSGFAPQVLSISSKFNVSPTRTYLEGSVTQALARGFIAAGVAIPTHEQTETLLNTFLDSLEDALGPYA